MTKVCDPIFGKKVNGSINTAQDSGYKESNNAWFDQECKEKRELFYLSLNKYRQCNNDENRMNMCTCRSAFKNAIKAQKIVISKKEYRKTSERPIIKCQVILETTEKLVSDKNLF